MPKRNLIWTAAIVAAGVATVLLTRQDAPRPATDGELERLRGVAEAWRVIRDNAYRLPEEEFLQRGAVRGLAEGLDEYSSYVPPDRIDSFLARLDGQVACTGLLVDLAGGEAEVLGALPGSPAFDAGIGPGGRLVAVDGRDVADLPAGQVRALLEGPGPDRLTATIEPREGPPRTYSLRRKRFELETVVGLARTPKGRWEYLIDPAERVAYVRIREFGRRTPDQFQQALRELTGSAGIVLDLRDNPGGRLEAGYAVANLFLREGVIFTQVDRRGMRVSHSARREGTHPDVPMAVLINGSTASAAELVAGALGLYGRAAVIGTRSRGKGLIQSMIALPEELGQVNLTTGEFLVGTDQRVERRQGDAEWGVEPHRTVAMTAQQERQRRLRWARAEAAWTVPPRAPGPAATVSTTAFATHTAGQDPTADPQLQEAAHLLGNPGDYRALLAQAAAERAERATRPAGRQPPTLPAPPDAKGHE